MAIPDQTITPEAALSVPGGYQIEGDRVVVLLEEPLVLDATDLLARLQGVLGEADTSGDLRDTADQIQRRLRRRPDTYALSDAAGFLTAIGSIPLPETAPTVLTEEQRGRRRYQLGLTLAATLRRGDTDGTALVSYHLAQLD